MDSDEALFERMRAGDMAAFDRLYDRLEGPLFGFIRVRLGDQTEAEDVLQETFLAVLRERDRAASLRSVRAWLYQVAHNLCLNRLRSRRRAGKAMEAVGHADATIDPSGPAQTALEAAERARVLSAAVERLPPTLAELYHLRASGLSYEEVAEITEVPLGTVKSRMHELVKRLREEMTA